MNVLLVHPLDLNSFLNISVIPYSLYNNTFVVLQIRVSHFSVFPEESHWSFETL